MIECYDDYTYSYWCMVTGMVLIAGPLAAAAVVLIIASVARAIQNIWKRIRRG